MVNTTSQENLTSSSWKVGSVAKALNILDCFDQSHLELTLNDLSKMLNMPKSTLSNLIRTLENAGYLTRKNQGKSYSLGYKILELSYFLHSSMPIGRYALPVMEDLQILSRENVYLTTHINGRILYLEALFPSRRSAKYSISGKTLPMHCTSSGKAMLSYLPEQEVEMIIERWGLPAITPNTITEKDVLLKQIEIDRSRGYSVDVEEESLGVKCVAVAIRNSSGRSVGALSISGSVLSMTNEMIPKYASELSKACNILSDYADLFPSQS